MSEELFDVVFFGILQAGKDKETVIQNMAALFKTDASKLVPFFAGGRKVIKAKINAAAAEKYKAALENVGLVITVEPVATAQSESPTKAPADTTAAGNDQTRNSDIDTGDMTVAPVGADVLEHPVEVPTQKIEDISSITMAEPGVDVLEHPPEVVPQRIDDISDISLAEVGVDIIETPQPKEKAKIPDISELSLDDEK